MRRTHAFWRDEFSLLDDGVIDPDSVLGPRKISGVYLLALSVRKGGRFVAFDTAVPVSAVTGARKSHLLVL